MIYKAHLFKITSMMVMSLTMVEDSFAERPELFDHPLFDHQRRIHNAQETELILIKVPLEVAPQPGWFQWASSYAIGGAVSNSPPSSPKHATLELESNKLEEGWGSWFSQSIWSSISYAGQMMGAVVQAVFATTREDENNASDILPSVSVQPILEEIALEPTVPNKFDTITYVQGMRDVIEGGMENADSEMVVELLEKDAEVQARFSGPQERFPDALRKAEWLRSMDENFQEVTELRHAKKKGGRRLPLRGSQYFPPVRVE